MTSPTPQIRTQRQGDGTTTAFACGFALQDATHVKAYVGDGTNSPVLQTGITVTDVGLDKTASVTLTSAPANGHVVTLVRDVPAGNEGVYLDELSFDADSLEDALHLLHGERGNVLTMEMFGAVGGDKTKDSAAWNAMITAAHESGKTVLLNSRHYDISDAVPIELNDLAGPPVVIRHPVKIIGIGTPVLDGGTDGVTLFKTKKYGLTFRNVTTKNVCLIDVAALSANIDKIDIRDWTWDNSGVADEHLQKTVRISERFATAGLRLNHLVLRNIDGNGGLGGIAIECAIENVDIDGYVVRNIKVPFLTPDDGANKTKNDRHYKNGGDDMENAGYSDGLLLGDDDPDAQEVCKSWSIGKISISDIEDQRQQRPTNNPSGQVSACDGVRLMGQNMTIGQIDVRDVRSAYKEETTGVYFKARNTSVGTIYVENAGGHEAGCVFKGARRTNGDAAKGFNISVDTLRLFANDNKDRCAVYLGTDDIHIGFLSIEGYGGEVTKKNENNQLELLGDSGPLVFCESTNKQRLHIDQYSIVNCQLGALSGDEDVELFSLRGYREIKIGAGFINEVSNDKHVAVPTTDTNYPGINVFHWTDNENSQPVKSIEIGPLVATNFRTKNPDNSATEIDAKVTLFNLDARNFTLSHFMAWNPVTDQTVNVGLRMHEVTQIDQIQVIGGDLSSCVSVLELNGARPAISVLDCLGLATRNTSTTDNTAIRDYAIGSIRPSVVVDPVDDLFFLNGAAAPLSSFSTFSRNIDSFQVRKDGGLSRVLKQLPRLNHHTIVDGIFQRAGLKVEKSSTSKLIGSESFTRQAWNKAAMNLAIDHEIAPDNSNTAQKFTETALDIKNFVIQNFDPAPTGEQVLSVFAKESGRTRLLLGAEFTSNQFKMALFDIENGTVLQDGTGIANGAKIVQFADGWYRCSILTDVPITKFAVGPFDDDTFSGNLWPKYVGNVDKGVLLWGPQLEEGKRPTSFISTPTGNASEERTPDSLDILANNMPSSSAGYVFVVKGFVTYDDSGDTEATLLKWGSSETGSTKLFEITLETSGNATGHFNARMIGPDGTLISSSSAIGAQLTPGIDVPFALALQATPTSLRLFVNGTAGTATNHVAGLPSLAGENCNIAPDFTGSLTDFRVFDVPLSEALLTTATTL